MDFDASIPIYAHDANGNLTNVVRLADNARVLSCRYDALGRRVEAIRTALESVTPADAAGWLASCDYAIS